MCLFYVCIELVLKGLTVNRKFSFVGLIVSRVA